MCFWLFTDSGSKTKFFQAPQTIFMFGFLCALVASHLRHLYFGSGGALTAFTDFSKTIIMYTLIANVVNSEKKFGVTIGLLTILTLILAIQGIMQHKTGYGWAGQPLLKGGRITWIGIFNDPNDLALAFVIIVPFLLNAIFISPIRYKIISLPILGTLLYAIYLTNSRGGVLALLTAIFYYFFFYLKRKGHPILGIAIAVFFVAILFAHGPSRMKMLSVKEASAYGRIEAWYEGIQMLKSAPLFGVGYRMFTDYYFLTAHNSIMLCAAETGLIGLFFWVGLYYFCFKNLLNLQKAENESSEKIKNIKYYAFALEAGLIGFLASAFFLSRTYITLPYIMIALVVALFNVGQERYKRPKNKIIPVDLRNIGLVSLGSLILIYVIMKVVL